MVTVTPVMSNTRSGNVGDMKIRVARAPAPTISTLTSTVNSPPVSM